MTKEKRTEIAILRKKIAKTLAAIVTPGMVYMVYHLASDPDYCPAIGTLPGIIVMAAAAAWAYYWSMRPLDFLDE